MAEPEGKNEFGDISSGWPSGGQKVAIRSSVFKYYIHDGADALRLQLLGDLTELDVPDLNGCWRTAKTTMGNRGLVLDLRRLKSIDDAGKQWLASMADEGAVYLPDTYLRNGLAGQNFSSKDSRNSAAKLGLFGRLLALFRGSSIAPAD